MCTFSFELSFIFYVHKFIAFSGGHDACQVNFSATKNYFFYSFVWFVIYKMLSYFQGDSGGLITCGGKNELTGVVSFGDSCGIPEFPGNFLLF